MSEMQLRLREEQDVENAKTESRLFVSLDKDVLTYGGFEDLCCMDSEIYG